MATGENEQGLHKILDMSRLISVLLLGLHFYYNCYRAFEAWKLTAGITERLMENIRHTGLFNSFITTKLWALGFLIISLSGARGRKEEKLTYKAAVIYIGIGLVVYFCSYWLLLLHSDSKNITLVS